MGKYIKIKCGKLYDGLKAELQKDMEILIEGRYIKKWAITSPSRRAPR
ncbi:MAG: hypothetical protein ACI4N0_05915 [Christensenellales bacterium]